MTRSIRVLATALATGLAGSVGAAPVTYNFSTQPSSIFNISLPGVPASVFSGGVYGSFVYDSQALFVANNPDGSALYRGSTPESATGFVTAISGFSGNVGAFHFTDASGSLQVGNDFFFGTDTVKKDVLQFSLEPALTSTFPHNLTRFSIGDYTLGNMRMFWIEGQATPGVVPDFLTNQDMPATLPTFTGRLALDFFRTDNPSAPLAFILFDGLQVTPALAPIPEPETYAMLVAGLGLIGFVMRRRLRMRRAV